jgi:hypothetical protein
MVTSCGDFTDNEYDSSDRPAYVDRAITVHGNKRTDIGVPGVNPTPPPPAAIIPVDPPEVWKF